MKHLKNRMMRWLGYCGLLILTLMAACQTKALHSAPPLPAAIPTLSAPTTRNPHPPKPIQAPATQLIDIHSISPTIVLDIRYATVNNFMGKRLYPQARCLLRVPVAAQLASVQADLQKQGLGLKVYDCYRPLSVQRQMWKLVPDTRYVANPATGSRHNRGSAVDVTLVDRTGKELEMPTEFDHFTEQAHINYSGASTKAQKNRQLLEQVMTRHGFVPLPTEWWHFDAKNWSQFSLSEVPLDAIP